MTDDERYDDDELADARALAAVLESGGAPEREVGDALDAADVVALLKAPLLDEARADAIVAEASRRIAEAKRRSRRRATWIGSAAGALALAAAALLMVRVRHEPSQSEVTQAPRAPATEAPATTAPSAAAPIAGGQPDDALRAAQLAWLSGPSPQAAAALESALAAYRGEQLALLERRYGR